MPPPSSLAQSKERKGSKFAIWQYCTQDNLPFRNLPKKWLVGFPLLIVGLWVLSCICTTVFYKAFHPWKAINGTNVRGAVLCQCADRLRDCEAEKVPKESEIEMEYFSSWTN